MTSALSDAPSSRIGPSNLVHKRNHVSHQFYLVASALFASAACVMADEYTQPVAMPPVTVTATNELAEETPLGPNRQPEWTARRRFATTRIYVQPPWQFEAESGWDAQ